jgi:glycosyltransferase involved in cell wall biosynthesis
MNVYFYPITTKANKITGNPYTDNFIESLRKYFTILNYTDASSIGILKTWKYLFKIDVLLVNWIEDLPDKKGGYIQSFYFFLLIFFLKIRKKKLVWILHNKFSHYPVNYRLKKQLFRFLIKQADLIVTHASEGVSFARSFSKRKSINIHYFPHPIIPVPQKQPADKEIDVLIWGAITPYKGIDQFLKFLSDNHLQTAYCIKIAGKIPSPAYEAELMKYKSETIQIEDSYIDREKLEDYIHKSKVVLFTYSSDSILSSGALIDTLALGATILGPNKGNFIDLNAKGMISVYNDYQELADKLGKLIQSNTCLSRQTLDNYYEETSWERFASELNKWLSV